jgi:hypothetical protein
MDEMGEMDNNNPIARAFLHDEGHSILISQLKWRHTARTLQRIKNRKRAGKNGLLVWRGEIGKYAPEIQ